MAKVVSIASALESAGIFRDQSVYADFSLEQMNFRMALIGELDTCDDENLRKNFICWRRFSDLLESKKESREYQDILNEIREIDSENRKLNASMNEIQSQGLKPSDESIDAARILRTQKKAAQVRLDELEQRFVSECREECAKNGITLGTEILRYKKKLLLNRYENIREFFPQLPVKSNMPYWHEMPFFTNNLTGLQNVTDIGIEGGPCLFGLQEVYVVIVMNDGTEHKFDYNTAHYGAEDTGEKGCESLEELFTNEADKVTDVYFIDNKRGLTVQEYYELLYPFELADRLDAKLVIPIPDLSYIKYVTALAEKLNPRAKNNMISRFKNVCYRITDLMLDKIDELKALYKNVTCKIVHDRDKELYAQYEERREYYLMSSKSRDILRHLTKNEYRQNSVLDYCTMPALPLYLYGIRNIIQIDCVNEIDSYRKCCQLHKTKINLAALLYPEYLSRDGQHTVFYSKIEDKDYLQ